MLKYNSRDVNYKSVFGAAPEEQPIRFAICLPRSEGCTAAHFVIRRDDTETERFEHMFWAGMCGDDHEWWDITFIPETEGLYWYRFEVDTKGGRKKLSLTANGVGEFTQTEVPWQLTIYQKDLNVPDWLKGGIMYQIFPDRFARSEQKKENVPDDRILREDWGGQPYFRPDEHGRVWNNDYFGGDLTGIIQHLDHLSELGVTCLYLNPIFEAHSNHRYDTADYAKIDPLLGKEEDLKRLCREAEKRGISVILDGVFSHTGADSVYFNKNHRYPARGAYNATDSPYFNWYTFQEWPDRYSSWWGIDILPEVKEENPDFIAYICGENGILRKWLRAGIRGWRLDVADELPDKFLDALREAVKAENPEAFILGEVWEDATNKISYGYRRRFLRGRQLDSVMNYPFRGAILDFLKNKNAAQFINTVMQILENYPKPVIDVLMNHIGTHDTERAITCLVGEELGSHDREWQSCQRLSREQYTKGITLMKLAVLLQYTLPGVPSIYYGDEAGMQGYRDPFNRGCYPWNNENEDLLSFYRQLGVIRRQCDCLRNGMFLPLEMPEGVVGFEREGEKDKLLCIVNRNETAVQISIPSFWNRALLQTGEAEANTVKVEPLGGILVWDAL